MTSGQISFSGPTDEPVTCTDEEFVRHLGLRKSANPRFSAAAAGGNVREFARILSRNWNLPQQRQLRTGTTPSLLQPLWSRHAFGEPTLDDLETSCLIEVQRALSSDRPASRIRARLDELASRASESGEVPAGSPLRLLEQLTLLREVGGKLSPPVLLSLWRAALERSLTLLTGPAPASVEQSAPDDLDDRNLLIRGELPWCVGLVYSPLRGSGRLRKAGQRRLCEGLEALTDRDGTPHARALHRLPLTLAVLTRSVLAGEAAGHRLWGDGPGGRFARLVGRTAALCHADGRIALSNGASFAPASLMRTALAAAGVPKREPSAQRLLSLPEDLPSLRKASGLPKLTSIARRAKRPRFDQRVAPSLQSDWAELACLRNNWLMGADSCIVTHHQSPPQICLTAFERGLLDGSWSSEVRLDGDAVSLDGEWTCVCWFSDHDADYLELQLEAAAATVSRQVMLSRTDHWVFLSEAVIVPHAGQLELATHLPLAADVDAEAARWTRDVRLSQRKLKAAVYPLALDQQRVQNAHGTLDVGPAELILRQQAHGTAVFAPLVIDWSPDRRRARAIWRRLTVAEDGRILGPETASGFRLQIGRHQWLYYRSLKAGETGRTVLGHHTLHETVIGEFTAQGTVEPLVMVE